MAVIEHDFNNGLTVRNGTIAADYQKFYQNVFPNGGSLAGAVNPTDAFFNLGAYQHWTNRDNVFNQTDFTYKTATGPVFHTVGFGTEFGRQTGVDIRNTGLFPNGTPTGINTIMQNPFAPTYFGPVNFVHHYTAVNNGDGVSFARLQQQIRPQHPVRLRPRHDRYHPLRFKSSPARASIASTCRRWI